jgi:hypothetical protein
MTNVLPQKTKTSQIQRRTTCVRGAPNRGDTRTQQANTADSKRKTMFTNFRNIVQTVAEVAAATALLTLLGFIVSYSLS